MRLKALTHVPVLGVKNPHLYRALGKLYNDPLVVRVSGAKGSVALSS